LIASHYADIIDIDIAITPLILIIDIIIISPLIIDDISPLLIIISLLIFHYDAYDIIFIIIDIILIIHY
jgi:hypothetical protein